MSAGIIIFKHSTCTQLSNIVVCIETSTDHQLLFHYQNARFSTVLKKLLTEASALISSMIPRSNHMQTPVDIHGYNTSIHLSENTFYSFETTIKRANTIIIEYSSVLWYKSLDLVLINHIAHKMIYKHHTIGTFY